MIPTLVSSHALDGKRIVLFGGTLRVILAIAQVASQEGARLVIATHVQSTLDEALPQLSVGTEGYALDLMDETHVRSFFHDLGAFDHLVFPDGEPMTIDDIAVAPLKRSKTLFALRFWGVFIAVKYGHRLINGGGSIVMTSGIAGTRPQKGEALTASLCGAIESLARALAVDLAPIRVNVVAPGSVRSPLWESLSEATRDAMSQAAGETLLVGRGGTVTDIAEAYLYLMRAEYSTGQVITIDGGAALM